MKRHLFRTKVAWCFCSRLLPLWRQCRPLLLSLQGLELLLLSLLPLSLQELELLLLLLLPLLLLLLLPLLLLQFSQSYNIFTV